MPHVDQFFSELKIESATTSWMPILANRFGSLFILKKSRKKVLFMSFKCVCAIEIAGSICLRCYCHLFFLFSLPQVRRKKNIRQCFCPHNIQTFFFLPGMWWYQSSSNQYKRNTSPNRWFVYSPHKPTSSGRNVTRENNVDSGNVSSRRYVLLNSNQNTMTITKTFSPISDKFQKSLFSFFEELV